jgi:hypothetical protein
MAGAEQWTAVLNNVENLRAAFGDTAQIEVVAHGQGLSLLVVKGNALAKRMEKLSMSGVVFAASENTMKRQRIGKDQLLPFAITVDSGVAEVVRKQEAGWSYIKSGTRQRDAPKNFGIFSATRRDREQLSNQLNRSIGERESFARFFHA